MENEKQNDVEELVVNNETKVEPANVPETLNTNAAPVVEENTEVLVEPAAVDNNVEVPIAENNNEVAVNNEVILEPVPSQAQMVSEGEAVQDVSTPPVQEVIAEAATPVEEPVVEKAVDTTVPAEGGVAVENVVDANAAPVVNPEVATETPVVNDNVQPKKSKTGLIVGIVVVIIAVIIGAVLLLV